MVVWLLPTSASVRAPPTCTLIPAWPRFAGWRGALDLLRAIIAGAIGTPRGAYRVERGADPSRTAAAAVRQDAAARGSQRTRPRPRPGHATSSAGAGTAKPHRHPCTAGH